MGGAVGGVEIDPRNRLIFWKRHGVNSESAESAGRRTVALGVLRWYGKVSDAPVVGVTFGVGRWRKFDPGIDFGEGDFNL